MLVELWEEARRAQMNGPTVVVSHGLAPPPRSVSLSRVFLLVASLSW